MSKIITCICVLCFFVKITNAQLSFIGNDEINNKLDGYQAIYQTAGFVQLADKWYYITPNGNFCETDGTEKGTKIIEKFAAQTFAYFMATKKYVYFTKSYRDEYVKQLYRYSPTTGMAEVTNPANNNKPVYLNNQIVPGQNFMVDEVFANYDKDALLIRQFTKDIFYIFIINDFNDNAKVNLVKTSILSNDYLTFAIAMNTSLETFKTDVYCNGKQKPTGEYETTMNVFERSLEDNTKYIFKTNFSLLKNKMYPKEGFLRTKENIYSLIKGIDSATSKSYYNLFYYNKKMISGTKSPLFIKNEDVEAQTLEGNIFISAKGELIKYDENKEAFYDVIIEKDATYPWQNIAKNTRFLKVGNNYMYRRNFELFIYNSASKKTTNLANTYNTAIPKNIFGEHNTFAYTGKNSFYYSQVVDSKNVFTRYNTITSTTSQIEFPSFKKQDFEAINAVLHHENKIVFLTTYKGKRDKLIYKMFMYNEDGEAAKNTIVTVASTQPINQQAPKPTEFDITKFDTKLFVTEISKVIKDQTNKFKDIKGESVPHEFKNKYATTIQLTNFAESFISDFSSESNLWRYQAESFKIKGKDEALKFFNKLDFEVQNLLATNKTKRIVDVDFKTRKVVMYKFAETEEINVISLDLSTNASVENFEDGYYTITIRADKPAK
jgi:hypothetical protein